MESDSAGSDAPRKRKKPPESFWQRTKYFLKHLAKKLILPVVFCVIMFGVWFFLSQPDIKKLNTLKKTPSVIVKAEDGQIIGSYGDVYGEYIKFKEFPQSLVDAVLATEDRNFFHHFGVDPLGVARAMVANIRAGRTVQGGSTISQQLAKNVFLTPERTLMRKLREVVLAFSLETHFSKQEIFAIYLNRAYLGSGNFGVDAAAKRYFNKSARDLTLSESAIIAGLLKAPSRFAPTSNPELTRKRAEQILLNMQDAGYLNEKEVEKAKAELMQTVTKTAKNSTGSSMYFSDWVIDELPDFVGNTEDDLIVNSTLRVPLQRIAEQVLEPKLKEKGPAMNVSQGALVAMTPDGAVRAMMGGRDYWESQYNRAVQAKRQPGSSFKLFVYLAGLENGFSPDSIVVDQPVSVGEWQPKNYKDRYEGEMTLKQAVAQSINSVSVQVSEAVGRGNVVAMAKRLGIKSEIQPDPSIALGSNEVNLLELTGAYAHMAANGRIALPYGIESITTSKGKVLYTREKPVQSQVLNETVVGMMNNMLSGVISGGTGTAARIGRPAAGKTGTTSDYRDAWFMGYTPDLVCGVWVGNDNNAAMKKVTGGSLPAPIWHDFMIAALTGVPVSSLPIASGYASAHLPWRRESDDTEDAFVPALPSNGESPAPAPAPAAAPPRQPGAQGEFMLKKDFWNKLFDTNR